MRSLAQASLSAPQLTSNVDSSTGGRVNNNQSRHAYKYTAVLLLQVVILLFASRVFRCGISGAKAHPSGVVPSMTPASTSTFFCCTLQFPSRLSPRFGVQHSHTSPTFVGLCVLTVSCFRRRKTSKSVFTQVQTRNFRKLGSSCLQSSHPGYYAILVLQKSRANGPST